MTKIRSERFETRMGELDKIVVQLFDDLANGSVGARKTLKPLAKSTSPVQPDTARATPSKEATREDGDAIPVAPRAKTSSDPLSPIHLKTAPEDDEDTLCDEQETPTDAEIFFDEDELFIERTVSYLAFHPNANALLERITNGLRRAESAPSEEGDKQSKKAASAVGARKS